MALFPLPNVVSDVGPGGRIVDTMNALNDAKILQQNAFYNPQEKAAEIASKSTYAQYLPAQIAAQLLSNPTLATVMDRGQFGALANKFSNLLTNPQNPLANVQQQQQQGFGPQLINGLLGKLGLGGNQAPQNGQNPQNMQNGMMSPTGMNSGQQATNALLNQVSSGGGNAPAANAVAGGSINTPQGRLAAGLGLPGAMGGNNPFSGADAQKAALTTGASTGAANEANLLKETVQDATKQAQAANLSLANLENFKDAYDKATLKGPLTYGLSPRAQQIIKPLLGQGTDISPEVDASNYANNLIATTAQNLQRSGHITDNDIALVKSMKIDPTMPKASVEHKYNFMKEAILRDRDYLNFINAMVQNNPDATKLEGATLWNKYYTKYPFYKRNKEGITILPQNRDKWKLFSTKKALNELRKNPTNDYFPEEGKPMEKQAGKQNKQMNVPAQQQATVRWDAQSGDFVPVGG